jgi:hypothetical protein
MAVDSDSPKINRIEDLDAFPKTFHICISQPILTDIQVQLGKQSEKMINMSAWFEELGARMDEQNKNLLQYIETSTERLRLLEISSNNHKCTKETQIINMAADITNLKMGFATINGESKWVVRAVNIFQSVLIAVIVILASWFMKGGTIT